MIFSVTSEDNKIVFTGTKQDCMAYIKTKRLNRRTITIKEYDPIVVFEEKVVTKPKEFTQIKPKPFFKRIFSK